MILLFAIFLSPVMGVSLTIDDLSKEERVMWDKGQLIEKCFKGQCLVNKKAQDALDYKLDLKGRTKRWVEEFVKINNREPSKEELEDFFIENFWFMGPNLLTSKKWDNNFKDLDRDWNLKDQD